MVGKRLIQADLAIVPAGPVDAAAIDFIDPLRPDPEARRALAGYYVRTRHFFGRWFLDLLFLRDEARGQGLGTLVLEHLRAGVDGDLFTSTNLSNARMIHQYHLDPGDPELVFCSPGKTGAA